MTFDVTVISPVASSHVRVAQLGEGGALTKVSQIKSDKYTKDLAEQNIGFRPLVFETFGRWCRDTSDLISRIAKLKAKRTGSNFTLTHSFLKGRLSLLLQNHVGNMILARY